MLYAKIAATGAIIFVIGLILAKITDHFYVPEWAEALCGACIFFGTIAMIFGALFAVWS